jgi:hypothetical protein
MKQSPCQNASRAVLTGEYIQKRRNEERKKEERERGVFPKI